ncbi:hypothetical protein H4R19_005527, partial [Coemansia spiralis]
GKPWGIRYFLPMAEFTDNRWLRMNTILNKAVRVCDSATLKSVGSKAASDMRCDFTVTSDVGWEGLCSKTRTMLEHICKNDGLGNNEFFVKIDDDTLVDPRIEDYIMDELSGRDVYFGFSPGFIDRRTGYHNWFPGPFYGFSASVLKQVCACDMPQCTKEIIGEDQWLGYMLGECKIQKEDILFDKGTVYHREYSSPRISAKFRKYNSG